MENGIRSEHFHDPDREVRARGMVIPAVSSSVKGFASFGILTVISSY
jgi:hypothetical protein